MYPRYSRSDDVPLLSPNALGLSMSPPYPCSAHHPHQTNFPTPSEGRSIYNVAFDCGPTDPPKLRSRASENRVKRAKLETGAGDWFLHGERRGRTVYDIKGAPHPRVQSTTRNSRLRKRVSHENHLANKLGTYQTSSMRTESPQYRDYPPSSPLFKSSLPLPVLSDPIFDENEDDGEQTDAGEVDSEPKTSSGSMVESKNSYDTYLMPPPEDRFRTNPIPPHAPPKLTSYPPPAPLFTPTKRPLPGFSASFLPLLAHHPYPTQIYNAPTMCPSTRYSRHPQINTEPASYRLHNTPFQGFGLSGGFR